MKFLKKFLLLFYFTQIFSSQKEPMNIKDIFLNHIYTLIDKTTYNEIKKSDFLKNKFCHCEEKTHSAKGIKGNEIMSWTGFYITGKSTLIEIFNNTDKKKLLQIGSGGNLGIAFSVDQEKKLEKIINTFKQKYNNENLNYGIIEKNIDKNFIKWFYFLEITNEQSMMPELDSWIMTYHKDYFKNLNKDSITREEYNKKLNAVPFDKNKLLKDIEEITLLLNENIKRIFIERLQIQGFILEENDEYTILHGPEITFKLKLSNNQTCKLLELQMSLNSKINDYQEYKLGNSTIKLQNQTATWIFE